MVWMIDYSPLFYMGEIIYPCPYSHAGLTNFSKTVSDGCISDAQGWGYVWNNCSI